MSLKMNIEAAVHIDSIILKQLHKIGWVQYRISVYYEAKHFKSMIYLMASNIDFQYKKEPGWIEPSIGNDSHYCYSSKFKMQYLNEAIQDNVTFFFKGYIDISLIDKVKLHIQVDLLFSEVYQNDFKIIQSFNGRVKKANTIFAYLPVDFDKFGMLRLSGIYHAVLMQFKFQKNEDDAQYLTQHYKSMQQYLQIVTFGYRLNDLTNFYKYFRATLENQIVQLHNRLEELSKIKDKQFNKMKFIKLNQNKKIQALFNQLYSHSIQKASNHQKEQFVELFFQDNLNIKALIYKLWNEVNTIVRAHSASIIQSLKKKYEYEVRQRLRANIFSHRIKNHDWTFGKYENTSAFHKEQAQTVRKKCHVQNQLWQATFLIQGNGSFEDENKSLKIFQQIYETGNISSTSNLAKEYQHIVILVHGFQAHRNDFLPLKQCLQANHNIRFYISGANIGKTEDSLETCGKRLAIQINRIIQIAKQQFRISFIGHSMGGIIIRSAIKFLPNIRNNLHAYVSICSPHLGYLYSTSRLVHAGLWLINTLQKCDSIIELCMQDNKNLRQSFLYKLAQGGYLNSFKKLAFISSSQDEYVPYESARVQKNAVVLTQQLKNKGESQVICQMIDNILCQVQANEIIRLDVVFCIEETSLDSFLGRTGHVKFLSDPHFIRQFCLTLDHLFL